MALPEYSPALQAGHVAKLDYIPGGSDPEDATSGQWLWKFFPYVQNDIIQDSSGYDYDNHESPSDAYGGKDWDELILADVFTNAVNASWNPTAYNPDKYTFHFNGYP